MSDSHSSVRIGIQGEKDSFSYHAARTVFGDVEMQYAKDFYDCFDALTADAVTHIVIPIENSTYGSIYENYDNLTNHKATIVGEIYVRIQLNLLGLEGAMLESIRQVYSHPVALMQIHMFKKAHPDIEFVPYADTAKAVVHILEQQDPTIAACAGNYIQRDGLVQIAQHIEDNTTNYTRFLILSKDETIVEHSHMTEQYKTTFMFTLGEESGSLAKILNGFAEENIALSHIQSRPLLDRHWQYRFYVDALVHKDDPAFQRAVERAHLFVQQNDFHILGSYPCGESLHIT